MTRPSDAVARFGLICEDKTDAEALGTLVRRIASGSVGLRSRSGEGCGNLRKKAGIWARELVETGYDVIIVVHDLDRNRTTGQLNDLDWLRGQLGAIEMPHGAFGVHICIPIEPKVYDCDEPEGRTSEASPPRSGGEQVMKSSKRGSLLARS